MLTFKFYSCLQYSTKQLPKNVLASESKTIDERTARYKYDENNTIPADQLQALKSVNFEEIHVAKIAQHTSKLIKDASVDQKKQIINWEPTPLADPSKITNQYLMLSKIRLTSKFK